MQSNRFSAIALSCIVVLAALTAQSEEINMREGLNGYSGTADATIYADQPNNANGGHPLIFSGATGNSVRRALIRFDLGMIPPDARIDRVDLRLSVDRSGTSAGPQDIYTLHRLNFNWGEGAVNSPDPGGNGMPAQPGDATWLSNFHQSSQWSTPGGDFNAAPSVQASVGAQPGSEARFSSEGMIADVQNWVDNPNSNFGWILIGPEGGNRNARRFVSSEGSPENQRPTLSIQYTAATTMEPTPLPPPTANNDWIMYTRLIDPNELMIPGGSPDWGIYVIPADGSSPPLHIAQGLLSTPNISPDRSTLVYSAPHISFALTSGIYSQSFNGSFPRVLTPPLGHASSPSFSPDGSHVVYRVDIPAGGGSGEPTPTPTPAFRRTTSLTQTLTNFLAPKSFNQQPSHLHNLVRAMPSSNPFIAIASLDGAGAFDLFHLVPQNQGLLQAWTGPDWHPTDPNRIVVSIRNGNNLTPSHPNIIPFNGAALYVINPDATDVRLLFPPIQPDLFSGIFIWEDDTNPVWSPNGNFIAYSRQLIDPNTLTSVHSIHIIREDGSDAPGRQITPNLHGLSTFEGVNNISWSPDGEWLTFSLSTRVDAFGLPTGYDVFKVRSDGSDFTQLTFDQRSVYPVWVSGSVPQNVQIPSDESPARQVDLEVTRVFITPNDGNESFENLVEIESPALGDSIRFVADIVNNGSDNILNYEVELYVNGELFNEGSDSTGLGAGMSDRWRSSPWLAEREGSHTFEWRFFVTNDIDQSNNFLGTTFQVGTSVLPTQTPTPTATAIPIPTILPSPTPSSTPSPTPLPNPTVPPTFPTVTPSPTIISGGTMLAFEFNENSLEETGWKVIPGGFAGLPAGNVQTGAFLEGAFSNSTDNRGMIISVEPGEVAFAYSADAFETMGDPVVVRAMIRAQHPDATISLVALKGSLDMGAADGSLALHSPQSAQAFLDQDRRLILLYEPDGNEPITLAIQVASTSAQDTALVLIDRLEAIRLDRNRFYQGDLFFAD